MLSTLPTMIGLAFATSAAMLAIDTPTTLRRWPSTSSLVWLEEVADDGTVDVAVDVEHHGSDAFRVLELERPRERFEPFAWPLAPLLDLRVPDRPRTVDDARHLDQGPSLLPARDLLSR